MSDWLWVFLFLVIIIIIVYRVLNIWPIYGKKA